MKRVLIDECLPRQLKRWLLDVSPDHVVQTLRENGWDGMKNGALLKIANGKFDVLVTADKNMHHQQNFSGLDISVLVFPTNKAKTVKGGVLALTQSLVHIKAGQKTVMDMSKVEDWGCSFLHDIVETNGTAHHIFRP